MVPAEQEPNTVVAVLQKGYVIAERVLRPRVVTVTPAEVSIAHIPVRVFATTVMASIPVDLRPLPLSICRS